MKNVRFITVDHSEMQGLTELSRVSSFPQHISLLFFVLCFGTFVWRQIVNVDTVT